MLIKAYYVFFRGNNKIAQHGLKKLKDLKLDLHDVRRLHKRPCGKGTVDIVATVKGYPKDYDWTLLFEQATTGGTDAKTAE